MGKTTLSVDESTLERFKHIKQELDEVQKGVPDHSADSFLNALLDTWEAADDGYYEVDTQELVKELTGRMDDLEARLPRKVADELEDR
jgi:hypothetical protein